MKNSRSFNVLVVTPTFTGGSWVVVEELIKETKDKFNYSCFGLGPGRNINDVPTYKLPYFIYDKLPCNLGGYYGNIFFNFLYQIPLSLFSLYFLIKLKPKLLLANGFGSLVLLVFWCKVLKVPIIVYYGSFLERISAKRIVNYTFKNFCKLIDHFFVNSIGSKDDLCFVSEDKITVINHWTNFTKRSFSEREKLRHKRKIDNKFVLLFVGQISKAKHFDFFLQAIKTLIPDKDFVFWIIGVGEMIDEVKCLTGNNVEYFGFVQNREELSEFYCMADLVWSYGDVTYLAKPAIEALASGTPIIIPDLSAVLGRKERLERSLVSPEVGWLVRGEETKIVSVLLKNVKDTNLITEAIRIRCSEYAINNYSRRNIEKAERVIERIISKTK